MIELPQRSVTRFFIPLIDVLILLFAIFLLLPVQSERRVVTTTADGKSKVWTAEEVRKLEEEVEKTQATLREMSRNINQAEIDRLKHRINNLPGSLEPRELIIDTETGALSYVRRGRKPIPIDSEAAAHNLIDMLEDELRSLDKKRPLQSKEARRLQIIVRVPPYPSVHPQASEREKYLQWFQNVPAVQYLDSVPDPKG